MHARMHAPACVGVCTCACISRHVLAHASMPPVTDLTRTTVQSTSCYDVHDGKPLLHVHGTMNRCP